MIHICKCMRLTRQALEVCCSNNHCDLVLPLANSLVMHGTHLQCDSFETIIVRKAPDRHKHPHTNANVTQLYGAVCSASDLWLVDTCQSWVQAPSKARVIALSKKLYSHCLVLVGSRNGFERDLHKQKIASVSK